MFYTQQEYSSESETMLDLLTLIQHNPQWGIRWKERERERDKEKGKGLWKERGQTQQYNSSFLPYHTCRWLNKEGNPADYASPSDTLSSSNPQRSVSCRIRLTLGAVWEQLKFIIISKMYMCITILHRQCQLFAQLAVPCVCACI